MYEKSTNVVYMPAAALSVYLLHFFQHEFIIFIAV